MKPIKTMNGKAFKTFPIKANYRSKDQLAVYSYNRRQTDKWYREVQKARSVLKMAINRFLKNSNATSPRVEELTGISLADLVLYLETTAPNGISLATPGIEIDHIQPLCLFETQDNIESSLKIAFKWSNLRLVTSEVNKMHDLKPEVIRVIQRKIKAARAA